MMDTSKALGLDFDDKTTLAWVEDARQRLRPRDRVRTLALAAVLNADVVAEGHDPEEAREMLDALANRLEEYMLELREIRSHM